VPVRTGRSACVDITSSRRVRFAPGNRIQHRPCLRADRDRVVIRLRRETDEIKVQGACCAGSPNYSSSERSGHNVRRSRDLLAGTDPKRLETIRELSAGARREPPGQQMGLSGLWNLRTGSNACRSGHWAIGPKTEDKLKLELRTNGSTTSAFKKPKVHWRH
jgi:hypothetical protein